jgi:2-polyprenyl-3-methyl-5-hydroxy-6-metoxy-1,4-benzoquinol methylase
VTLTDYLKDALNLAGENWKLNLPIAPTLQLLDWRDVTLKEKFDVILASDVAYESKSFKPIMISLKKLLKSDGLILISEPNRKFADVFIKSLKDSLKNVVSINKIVVKDGIKYTITIYEAQN